jgi:hypothetical protein
MAAKDKLDLYAVNRADYVAPRSPVLVEIEKARYLSVEGRGAPGGDEFQTRLGALYNVAFTVKMERKFAGQDYAVCKLEGLWWGSGKGQDFLDEPPESWNWKLIIRVPDFLKESELKAAVKKLIGKGKDPAVADVRLEAIEEGRCVQVLHVGPYWKERETIARMKEFAHDNGLTFAGLHHEIYLSDPRRVADVRLKTILRHPVAPIRLPGRDAKLRA